MFVSKLSASVNNLFLQGKSVDEISLTVLLSVMKRKLELCNAGQQTDCSWQSSFAWLSVHLEEEVFGTEIRESILRAMLNAPERVRQPSAPALAALVDAIFEVEARCVATGNHRRDQTILTIKPAFSRRGGLDVIDVYIGGAKPVSEALCFVPRPIGPLRAVYLKSLIAVRAERLAENAAEKADEDATCAIVSQAAARKARGRFFKWHQEREIATLFEVIRCELLANPRVQEIAFVSTSDHEDDIARAFAMALSIAWNLPFPQASAKGSPVYLEGARRALKAA